MKKSLALLGTLSILLTLSYQTALAIQPSNTSKIHCTETGTDSDVTSKIGEITVFLDDTGNPRQIQISRQGHHDVPSINKTFDIKTSTVKNEIVSANTASTSQNMLTSASEIKKIQIITANDSDRRSLVLKINDQIRLGRPGSSFIYEYGKMQVSSIEETTLLSCEGKLQVPWTSPASVALEHPSKKLLEK